MEVKGVNCLLYLKCVYCKENGVPYLNTFTQKSIFFNLYAFINGIVINAMSKFTAFYVWSERQLRSR